MQVRLSRLMSQGLTLPMKINSSGAEALLFMLRGVAATSPHRRTQLKTYSVVSVARRDLPSLTHLCRCSKVFFAQELRSSEGLHLFEVSAVKIVARKTSVGLEATLCHKLFNTCKLDCKRWQA